MSSQASLLPIETMLNSWLDDPDVILFCGNWRNGAIMELLPRGSATLSGQRYDAPFNGLRELRIDGGAHHVHLDLGRLTRAWYVIAPSVCYGYRPSFELRLTAEDARPTECCGLGLALMQPYVGGRLRAAAVRRYLCRAAEHVEAFPGAVSVTCDRAGARATCVADWQSIESLVDDAERTSLYSMRALRIALRRQDVATGELA